MSVRTYIWLLCSWVAVASCGDTSTGKKEEEPVEKKERPGARIVTEQRSDKLLYLDTAKDMFNVLCQGWVNEDDDWALRSMNENSDLEIAHRSFYLSPGGTFVKNPRNAIDVGTWVYDDEKKTITFTYTIDRGRDVYKIAALAPDELRLLNAGINTSTILKFISRGKRLRNYEDDPFYIENNRWRLPPGGMETDEGIRLRLKANIRFFILYYRASIERKDSEVSFWGLPSPLKWYGGGIYLKKEKELPGNWIKCFYNKDQAMKAYKLAERLLEEKYEWPKKEKNWLKLNLAVLEQMYARIDRL